MDRKRSFRLIDKHAADSCTIPAPSQLCRCGYAYGAHGTLSRMCPAGIGFFVAKFTAEMADALTVSQQQMTAMGITELAGGALIVTPTLSDFDAKLTASILIADIEKAQAELETMRCHESEMRSILTMDLDTLIFNAIRAKHRMETNEWRILADSMLKPHIDSTLEAIQIHASAVLEITGKVDHIADMQADLDALKAVI